MQVNRRRRAPIMATDSPTAGNSDRRSGRLSPITLDGSPSILSTNQPPKPSSVTRLRPATIHRWPNTIRDRPVMDSEIHCGYCGFAEL
ncbi:hypothetical protein BZL30_9352 [Mycobacterium kansasii]|uniref:Uncharacterized protein n=1 Tax=Mycobacterium kansasii TaxID=1768 RepID=A0A1V3WCF8_MYCKA|nr:hypothetical protein BZL30_9352 [Mycobacterium kansasii]